MPRKVGSIRASRSLRALASWSANFLRLRLSPERGGACAFDALAPELVPRISTLNTRRESLSPTCESPWQSYSSGRVQSYASPPPPTHVKQLRPFNSIALDISLLSCLCHPRPENSVNTFYCSSYFYSEPWRAALSASEDWMICRYFSISRLVNAENSTGSDNSTVLPVCAIFAVTFASVMVLRIASYNTLTRSEGVPAGA